MTYLVNILSDNPRLSVSNRREASGRLILDVNIDDALISGNFECASGQHHEAHPASADELDAVVNGGSAVVVDHRALSSGRVSSTDDSHGSFLSNS